MKMKPHNITQFISCIIRNLEIMNRLQNYSVDLTENLNCVNTSRDGM